MNTKSVLAAAALAAFTLPGFAVDEGIQEPAPASSLTREEVRAELEQLQAADALPTINEASPTPLEAQALARRVQELQLQQPEAVPDDLEPQQTPPAAYDGAPEHLMFVSPQGTVVIIERVPDAALPEDGSLPFEHPAMPGDAR